MAETDKKLTIIKAARLIDGKGGPPVEYGAILLEGDKIRAVGTDKTVVPPEGADVQEINYEGKTILPGLVDAHVHLVGIGDGRTGDELTTLPDEVLTLQAARNARDHLYSGVTTVRDCGAKNRTTFMLRQAIEMGITLGPRLVIAGRPMAIIGGHLSYFGVAATGPDECRAAVRQLIKEGADFIKITATGGSTRTSFPSRPSFNIEELKAICDEAHKFGKHTVAHCLATEGIINVLDAGIDTIVHCFFNEPDGTYKYRPDVAERIASQGVFVNPTLHIVRGGIWALEEKMGSEALTEHEQVELDERREATENQVDGFKGLQEAGVQLVCGSDSAWARFKMGGFQHEVDAHVAAGASPSEAIVSATGAAAKSLWLNDTVGTLEPEKQGDVLVIDGDPSRDIKTLSNIVAIFQAGDLVDRSNYV